MMNLREELYKMATNVDDEVIKNGKRIADELISRCKQEAKRGLLNLRVNGDALISDNIRWTRYAVEVLEGDHGLCVDWREAYPNMLIQWG